MDKSGRRFGFCGGADPQYEHHANLWPEVSPGSSLAGRRHSWADRVPASGPNRIPPFSSQRRRQRHCRRRFLAGETGRQAGRSRVGGRQRSGMIPALRQLISLHRGNSGRCVEENHEVLADGALAEVIHGHQGAHGGFVENAGVEDDADQGTKLDTPHRYGRNALPIVAPADEFRVLARIGDEDVRSFLNVPGKWRGGFTTGFHLGVPLGREFSPRCSWDQFSAVPGRCKPA